MPYSEKSFFAKLVFRPACWPLSCTDAAIMKIHNSFFHENYSETVRHKAIAFFCSLTLEHAYTIPSTFFASLVSSHSVWKLIFSVEFSSQFPLFIFIFFLLAQIYRMNEEEIDCVRRFSIAFARNSSLFSLVFQIHNIYSSSDNCVRMYNAIKWSQLIKIMRTGQTFALKKEITVNCHQSQTIAGGKGKKWISTSAKDLIIDCDSFFYDYEHKNRDQKKKSRIIKLLFHLFLRDQASNTMVSLRFVWFGLTFFRAEFFDVDIDVDVDFR